MHWFDKEYVIEGVNAAIEGVFVDSVVEIRAYVETHPEDETADWEEFILYEKPVNMWVHQEVIAEDIFNKFQGMIKKAEKRLPTLVAKCEIKKSI